MGCGKSSLYDKYLCELQMTHLREIEEISHKRIVHKNGSVYATHIYSLNGHFKSVYATHIYSLNGHLTRKSVYATHIYSLNGHLTRKSVYAKSPLFHIFLVRRTFYPVQWLGEVGHPFTALLDLHHFISFQRSALCRRKM